MFYGKPSEDFLLWTLGEEETREMVKHALGLGVNFFDTANCYSHATNEEYFGQNIRRLGIRREVVVLALKVYFSEVKLKREAIMRELDGTLQRRQTPLPDSSLRLRHAYKGNDGGAALDGDGQQGAEYRRLGYVRISVPQYATLCLKERLDALRHDAEPL